MIEIKDNVIVKPETGLVFNNSTGEVIGIAGLTYIQKDGKEYLMSRGTVREPTDAYLLQNYIVLDGSSVIAPFDGLCSADMYPLKTPINKEYLLRYILSDSFNAQVATAMSSRVKMPKINQAELSKVLIPVPPIQEQNRIANKIKEAVF